MPYIKEIEAFIENWAPRELAEAWDNPGTLVKFDGEVKGVLCALDITRATVLEAAQNGCNVILAHHPVIFSPIKAIDGDSAVALLLQNKITAICAHTNLDSAKGGVNDTLAALFDMQSTSAFVPCGRIGTLKTPMTATQLAAKCTEILGSHGTFFDSGKAIKTLAVVSGAGGDFYKEAQSAGADCLLTGEMHYHHALDAANDNFSFVAAGHFETEYPITTVMAQKLSAEFAGMKILISKTNKTPFSHF